MYSLLLPTSSAAPFLHRARHDLTPPQGPSPVQPPPSLDREEPAFSDEPDLPQSEPTERPGDDSELPPEPSPETPSQPGQDDPQEHTPTGAPA